MKTIDSIVNFLQKVTKVVLTTIGLSMFLLALIHVFYRFVLNNSLSWSEELLKIMLVWFCLLSTSVIAVNREHVSIVIFKQKMPKDIEQVLNLVVQVILFVVSVVMIYIGIRMVVGSSNRFTAALRLPYIYAYGAVPVSFFVISIFELKNLVSDIVNYTNGEEIGPKDNVLDETIIANAEIAKE